jgi:hypothetical protein
MQKEADAVGHAQAAQFGAQRKQVVVVNPYGVVSLQQRRQGGREAAVDGIVALIVLAPKVDQAKAKM